jgi:putative flippase GtrA
MNGAVREAVRFAGVGLFNTAIGLAAIYGAMLLGASPAFANAIGYAIGLGFGFSLNRTWTFASTGPASRLFPKYLLIVAASYLLNLVALLVAINLLLANPYLAQLLGMGLYTTCVFWGCRGFVFTSRAG